MNLINFIVWLSAGAVIGWFASLMDDAENRHAYKPMPIEDRRSEQS